jgi:hypothetical protein
LKAKEILIHRFLQTAHDSNFKLKVIRLIIMWNSRNTLFLGLACGKGAKVQSKFRRKKFYQKIVLWT